LKTVLCFETLSISYNKKSGNLMMIRLRQNTLQLAAGMIGLRPDRDGDANHGEAGPSPTGLRRRVGYAVISLDTPQLAAGSFIDYPLIKHALLSTLQYSRNFKNKVLLQFSWRRGPKDSRGQGFKCLLKRTAEYRTRN
jgi:hypothetical protein